MSAKEDSKDGLILGQLSKLRHPWLLAIALLAFGIDLAVPDILPFVDEIVLGAVAATLAALRKKRKDDPPNEPVPETGTPTED